MNRHYQAEITCEKGLKDILYRFSDHEVAGVALLTVISTRTGTVPLSSNRPRATTSKSAVEAANVVNTPQGLVIYDIRGKIIDMIFYFVLHEDWNSADKVP